MACPVAFSRSTKVRRMSSAGVETEPDFRIAVLRSARLGKPRVWTVRSTVAPTLDELGRAMADYITLISDKVGPLPPPPPRGAGEIQTVLRRVNEQVGFGKQSPADGAKQFVSEANVILARG